MKHLLGRFVPLILQTHLIMCGEFEVQIRIDTNGGKKEFVGRFFTFIYQNMYHIFYIQF